MKRSLSLPARFVLLVLFVVVVPLGVMGYWLAFTAARSGEELLRSRLRQSNARVAAEIGGNWLGLRSQLLAFADHEAVQRGLGSAPAAGQSLSPPAELEARFDSLPVEVTELTLRDAEGRDVWQFGDRPTLVPTFAVQLPLSARRGGQRIGTLQARIPGSAVLDDEGSGSATVGAVVAVLDPAEGGSLRGLPFDPSLLAEERFVWEEENWVAEQRILLDPALVVISAAPLAEFAAPFEAAGRRGLSVLLLVALAATALAALITRRMTRSLAELAVAADAVSRGDLSARVREERLDEVGRVAQAFNRMAERLNSTLSELSHREALAAVGSFASELAHEVRNPLTAIKVDLQHVEEQLPGGSELRSVQRSAVAQVDRLDRTVAGVLQIARSGQVILESVDLRDPVMSAAHAVESIARSSGAVVRVEATRVPLMVQGDQDALQRLFMNLLANALQASANGGVVQLSLEGVADEATVTIRDEGSGIPADQLSRVREPFFSTRPEGTGLGLTIASRIAAAHQAGLRIESEVGRGTTVTVRFPRQTPDHMSHPDTRTASRVTASALQTHGG